MTVVLDSKNPLNEVDLAWMIVSAAAIMLMVSTSPYVVQDAAKDFIYSPLLVDTSIQECWK